MKLVAIIALCFALPAAAQFGGGQGDGWDASKTSQSTLQGKVGGVSPLYNGNAGDGFSNSMRSSYLNGTAADVLFSGGRGDGVVNALASYSLSGTNLAGLYAGGSGDGFVKAEGSFGLNGLNLVQLFSGGQADGFTAAAFEGLLNGTSSAAWFTGGAGDGFTAVQVQAYLNGLGLDALYAGGAGDGFAQALFAGTIKALPIQLISFDAEARLNYVLVKWVVAGETDVDFYTIERSHNGTLFRQLRQLPSQGNTAGIRTYSLTDDDPLTGRSYYRLKWTDLDGKEAYSKIRSVLFESQQQQDFLLFPNPNNGLLINLQWPGSSNGETARIFITNMKGEVVYRSGEQAISGGSISISLAQPLSAGSYVVQVQRNGKTYSKVLIVQ